MMSRLFQLSFATVAILIIALAFPVRMHGAEPPTDANIVGHVVDATDGDHLPYCLITVEDTHLTVMTDASGHYALRSLTCGVSLSF